ncbi:MAG: hypothetical protein GY842_24970 [bacterium]|nr:hypothetical protein [bacterium]
MKPSIPILAFLVLCPMPARADDPGLVVVVAEEPAPLQFTLPAGSAYQFAYDPARISLWDRVTKDNLISPGQVLTAPPEPGDADGDGDFDLKDFAALQRCFTGDGGGPAGLGCEAFDADRDGDVDLTDFAAGHASFTGPFAPLRGDLNANGRVDLEDYAAWSACLGGPLVIVAADYDQDGDVDLTDFGPWLDCLDGPGVPPGPQCQWKDFDGDNDVDLLDFAEFQVFFTGASQTPPGCDEADLDGDGDADLTDYGIFQTVFGDAHPVSDVFLTVYVEGLTPSVTLGDTAIDFLTDPDGNDVFEVQTTQAVTVVAVSVSPTSGLLGTAVNVNIAPAIDPLAFSPATTATWSGVYQPTATSVTEPFEITYDSAAVHESGTSDATLILGEGEIASGDPGHPALGGVLDGAIALHFAGVDVARSFLFTVEPSYVYVHGTSGAGDPVGEVTILDSIPEWNEYVTLENSYTAHVLLTVLAEKNAFTESLAPTALAIELVSEDAVGAEIDRLLLTCYLEQERGDDFGPDRLVYYSDWERPIVFVGYPVDDVEHPTLSVLEVDPDGGVFPIVGTP